MLKHKDNVCQPELYKSFLGIYKIKRRSKLKKKDCNFSSKVIKNSRILGLLPFTHKKIVY